MEEQNKKVKIVIGTSSFAAHDTAPMGRLMSAGYEVIDNPYKRKLTKNELLELLTPDVVGIIAGLESFDREVLEKSRLKVISRAGSGISNIDMDAANNLGITVCSTPDGPTEAVAELTIGAMLALMRMVPEMDYAMHKGEWTKKIGCELQGKTIAIVGFGRIGRRVAELLSPFRAHIIVVDPFLNETDIGFERMLLDEALGRADIVTLHCSGAEQILGRKEFSLMKDGVFLLNAARGSVISEEAMIEVLGNGKIAGAWLDVFHEEPYSGPLCKFRNVMLTPHVGSYTREGRSKMEREAVENLIGALEKIL